MQNMLKVMFKEFNKKELEAGDYFVDKERNEIGFVNDGGLIRVCDIDKIESVIYSDGMIILEGDSLGFNEILYLTKAGPEY